MSIHTAGEMTQASFTHSPKQLVNLLALNLVSLCQASEERTNVGHLEVGLVEIEVEGLSRRLTFADFDIDERSPGFAGGRLMYQTRAKIVARRTGKVPVHAIQSTQDVCRG